MRTCEIPGTTAYEMHAIGVLCGKCQAEWDAEEREYEWAQLSPTERIATRWAAARYRIDRLAMMRRYSDCPF